jgi:transcriptional regulator with XRE-family HTH domain
MQVTWFLKEWMDALGVRQADMVREAGWSKTTASLLYNCQQDMNVDLLKSAAVALKRQPYELLMPPEDAFQIIRHRQEIEREALRLVSDRQTKLAGTQDDDDLPPSQQTKVGKG